MSKVLAITGATGKKSGGYFLKCISNNIEMVNEIFPDGIKFLTRKSSDISSIKKYLPSAAIVQGDLNDVNFLKQSLKNVDTLVHIAGIRISVNIVDAAKDCNVRRLILVHTTGVYSKYKKASSDYKIIDKYVKDICKNNNILLTICRPTMIYGNVYDNNVIRFIKMVDKLPLMPIVNGANYELQPVHYKDLGKAYFDILINENNTSNKEYNLSGKTPIKLKEMFEIIGYNLGKKVKFINCPFVIAYIGSWFLYCISFGGKDYREKVQRLCETRTFSHSDATNDFGYNPLSFEEGIVEEVKQYLS